MSSRSVKTLSAAISAAVLAGCGESSGPGSASPADGSADTASAPATPVDQAAARQQTADRTSLQSDPAAAQEAADQAMAAYRSGLDELDRAMQSVRDKLSAIGATPQINAAVDQVKQAWTAFGEVSPELQAQVISSSRAEVDRLLDSIDREARRIAEEVGLPDVAALVADLPRPGAQ